MGIVALGFRSLLIRAAVFFAMAAMLTWILGGTLWPAKQVITMTPFAHAGKEWAVQLMGEKSRAGPAECQLVSIDESGELTVIDGCLPQPWYWIEGPVLLDGSLLLGVADADGNLWLLRFDKQLVWHCSQESSQANLSAHFEIKGPTPPESWD
ncbi:MAG: hypothetical protein EXS00_00925 [Phycisphaerales bacterium]|nr:hypothetical protein [Phycisphaerales bacterium]